MGSLFAKLVKASCICIPRDIQPPCINSKIDGNSCPSFSGCSGCYKDRCEFYCCLTINRSRTTSNHNSRHVSSEILGVQDEVKIL
jgi:hypothetical protein